MKENLHLGKILRFSSYFFVSLKGKTSHENILLSKNVTTTLIISVSTFFCEEKN